MKGTLAGSTIEWFEFPDPTNEEIVWRVHIPFMLSNWQCLFGQGCPGLFGSHQEKTVPDMGCCGHGAYVNSKEERDRLQKQVDLLTEEDLGPKALAYVRKFGWLRTFDENPDDEDPDVLNAKTKVRDGGCVFANRADDGDGKIGCAFVHLGNRQGLKDHIDTMPTVCWQLPITLRHTYDKDGVYLATEVVPWDADHWGGMDDDGTHDSWMSWWCVDTPDAYNANSLFYIRYRRELSATMNPESYAILEQYLKERVASTLVVHDMPGTVANDGRPLLPLLVGNRTPKRALED